ncbi:MAG TPA: 3-isopropylmalate dehydratase small subunit [Candidatus Paceibacterota bacterium]|nr:3-isopropylmalate dehydratase small subunit [Candidatus Paceibacterota bacterium]
MISGKALKFGDNVDTDVILPGKYLVLTDPIELSEHAMEGLDSVFTKKARDGVILVAGKNFGCGSSREQAPLALKYAGVKCVIAKSFARIFYRNAINIGLPVAECGNIYDNVADGDDLAVDLIKGVVENKSKETTFNASQLPVFILEILSDGGLIENLGRRIKRK